MNVNAEIDPAAVSDIPICSNRRPILSEISRRNFLKTSALAAGGALTGEKIFANEPKKIYGRKALVAITLDLEMARNFPNWDDTHWDFEKGNLDAVTKKYAVEAARRVKAAGGVIHFFLVGSALEQENVDWLKEIIGMGHSIGNHTYNHVYLLAQKPDEIQFKFKRAPWLIEGKTIAEVLDENIRMTNEALISRLGIRPAGFRTPGGFANGLTGREDIQNMLLKLGFKWVSGKYPAHPNSIPGVEPTPDIFDGIVKAQLAAQPFVYPTGLIEIPMSPISDVGAFRNGKWTLEQFLKAIRLSLDWAIESSAVFDFLAHPAVLSAKDPEFKTIDLICAAVKKAGDRATLVNLEAVAALVADGR